MPNDPQQYAHVLYDELRKADESKAKIITIEKPPHTIEWLAIHDRLMRSTARSEFLLKTKEITS